MPKERSMFRSIVKINKGRLEQLRSWAEAEGKSMAEKLEDILGEYESSLGEGRDAYDQDQVER